MNVFDAIKWRRSVREFSPRQIERDKVLTILEAARLSPSSSNTQSWHFVVIDERAIIETIPKQVAMGERAIIPWIKEAPIVIAGCYRKSITHIIGELFQHENYLIDVTIALTHMVIAATTLGIGTCFVGWFNQRKLKRLLDLPADYNIACLVAMGYPRSTSTAEGIGGISPRPRKPLKDIVSHNHFGIEL